MIFENFARFIAHGVISFFLALQQEKSFEDRLHDLIFPQLRQARGFIGDLNPFFDIFSICTEILSTNQTD